MAERYSRLYSLPQNLHTEGSPIVIVAGALLRDTISGKVLAQLKLRNISQKTVTAVKVHIRTLDTAKAPLEGVENFSYLDLSVAPHGEFGQNVPIVLPDAATRSFAVEIVSVVCSDGEVFASTGKTAVPAAQEVVTAIREQNEIQAAEVRRKREEKAAQDAANAKAHKKQLLLGVIPLALAVLYIVLHMISVRSANGNMMPLRIYFRHYGVSLIPVLLAPALCLVSALQKNRFKGLLVVVGCVAIVTLLFEILGGYLYAVNNLAFPAASVPKALRLFSKQNINWFPGCGWMMQIRVLLRGGKAAPGVLRNLLPMITACYTCALAFVNLKKRKQ